MRINEEKFDRQLRLWGIEGQLNLSNSTICCFGSSAAATETLKNLILPGIGSFIVLDDAIVTSRDFGNNFFLEESDLGRSRAEATVERLLELNPMLVGKGKSISDLTQLPDLTSARSIVVLTNEWIRNLKVLAYVRQTASYVVSVESIGFIARVSLYGGLHVALEPKSEEGRINDLMIRQPWPELKTYIESFSLDSGMSDKDFYHVPWLVLLAKAVACGCSSRKEILNALERIEGNRKNGLNFQEARDNVFMITALADEDEIMADLITQRDLLLSQHLNHEVAHAISGIINFMRTHARFPVNVSALPDMTSDTKPYTALLELYRSQFTSDLQQVVKLCPHSVSEEIAQKVLSNYRNLQILKLPELHDKLDQSVSSPIPKRMNISDPVDDSGSLDAFDDPNQECIVRLLDGEPVEVESDLKKEFLRYGNDIELHSISAVAGAAAAQEIVKLITNQFVPIENSWVFNGIDGTAFTYKR